MILPPLGLDFETYYDKTYTLKKLDGPLYVLDPRFEIILFSYAEPGQKAKWFSGTTEEVRAKLIELDIENRTVIAHHAMFDGSILEWVLKLKPKHYLCTMMAARPFVTPYYGKADLRTCAKFWGLPDKGDYVEKVAGLHRGNFTATELAEYGGYSCNDTELSLGIAAKVKPLLPRDEVDLIDLTIKKYLRGRLMLDVPALEDAKAETEISEARALLLLSAMNLTKQSVTSNQQFAYELEKRGVQTPLKLSPTTGKMTAAFAKKDPEFMALAHHPDPEVRSLIEARLELKSSIERTRIEMFLEVARRTPTMPVPLLYYGAHTGRFSGMMGLNLQNLPKKSALRRTLRAPLGYKVIVADLSAIEARIVSCLAGEYELTAAFARGEDVYSQFASQLYGYTVTNTPEFYNERFIGKMCILGLGYGMGPSKFRQSILSAGIELTEAMAVQIVAMYRHMYRRIRALWKKLDTCLAKMAMLPPGASSRTEFPHTGGTALDFSREGVTLPNGMTIRYPCLALKDGQATYLGQIGGTAMGTVNIWGGGLCENIVQALARIVISTAELRLARAGLVSVMQVHDELVFVVPEHAVEKCKTAITAALTAPVPWMPSLPLACSVGVGDTYGDAK